MRKNGSTYKVFNQNPEKAEKGERSTIRLQPTVNIIQRSTGFSEDTKWFKYIN